MVKSLDSFDFLALPSLNKALVLELARGEFIDRKELFYRSGDNMMVVSIQAEPIFRASRPQSLFEGSYVNHSGPLAYQYYDISPDGKRFLMMKEGTDTQTS